MKPSLGPKLAPPARSLPEIIPSVSFAIDLKNYYKEVDFDYEAFANFADVLGLEQDTIQNLNIVVEKKVTLKSKRRGITLPAGYYNSREHSLHVAAGGDVNSIFVHELQHVADRQHHEFDFHLRTRLGNASMEVLPPVALFYIGSLALGEFGNKTAEMLHQASLPATLGVTALALYGYIFSPEEMRARKAAKIYPNEKIITLQPLESSRNSSH